MSSRSSRYNVRYRRRLEGKTDYRARKAFVVSGKLRAVIRSSLKNITVQVIEAKPDGDNTLVSAHSRELSDKYGWKAPLGNLPSAYLTGFLCGLKAKSKSISEVIPDIGLHSPSKGARVFAALKGVADAGVSVPFDEKKMPDAKRIGAEHIVEYVKMLASDAEEYAKKFSKYREHNLQPENLASNFQDVKKQIAAAFKAEVRPIESKKK